MMAKKKSKGLVAQAAVSLDRSRRLVRMVQLVGGSPMERAKLMRALRLDVRGFYRDLQCLRSAGINLTLRDGLYKLVTPSKDALALVPFPDPGLSLGEAMLLAKGSTGPHQKLKKMISELVTTGTKTKRK
jgi:predicted DNA-binding transcriptional regulator YafY